MKYAKIDKFEIVNGEGIGISLYTQGCRFHCKNCFNSELWDYTKGKEWSSEVEDYLISLLSRDYIDRISFLGGEPLSDENLEDLDSLLNRIRKECPSKKIWMYTGYTYEAMLKNPKLKKLLSEVDVLVDGKFILEERSLDIYFRGSRNQRVIDVPKSLGHEEIVLVDKYMKDKSYEGLYKKPDYMFI